MAACRRVWSSTPLRASTSTSARSRVGRAGHHVAGVLLVAGRVGQDEAAARGFEIAVGDVDGDALLALGGQAVDQQRVVDAAPGGAEAAGIAFQHGHHVVGDGAALEQQAADQGGLAVVDAAAGQHAQQGVGHQKYPSRFFVFHRGVLVLVDQPPGAFGDARGAHLGDDLLQRGGGAIRPRRTAGSSRASGTAPAGRPAFSPGSKRMRSSSTTISAPSRTTVGRSGGEIQRHHVDALGQDVGPHVELGPVGQREDAQRLARARGCRCRGATAPGAGASGPRCGRGRAPRTPAPWRASVPRRAGRRRWRQS